ncbi:Zinc finger protein 385B [Takifugu flavidus]|uniref:Zinc finger protein 385B n=1 Tax=Takifugu flavidus TaxID=433684 RepID=A0A5C6PMT9_9TELE|nr:Zinc finger protein 385B [Takifugu flavidus]
MSEWSADRYLINQTSFGGQTRLFFHYRRLALFVSGVERSEPAGLHYLHLPITSRCCSSSSGTFENTDGNNVYFPPRDDGCLHRSRIMEGGQVFEFGGMCRGLMDRSAFSLSAQQMQSTGQPVAYALCEVCNLQLTSDAQAQLHYNGKSHLRRLRQLQAGETGPQAPGNTTQLAECNANPNTRPPSLLQHYIQFNNSSVLHLPVNVS